MRRAGRNVIFAYRLQALIRRLAPIEPCSRPVRRASWQISTSISPTRWTDVPRGAWLRASLARVAIVVVAACSGSPAHAADVLARFVDPADGMFDLSEWLLERKGFLPVPIVITEPAVGYGAGIGLVFFREPLGDVAERARASGHVTPPDVFGVAAFATSNGTKGAAAGGQWTFGDDRYRYRGGIGQVSINLDFYGIGGELPTSIDRIGYNLRGFGSFQQGMMRLGDSDTFVGARWVYLDLATRLDVSASDAGLTARELARRSSGLGVTVEHDSRDNIFTPNRGTVAAAEATFYDRSLGSSNGFQAYRARVFHYAPMSERLTVALRADLRMARGDVPFYFLPYIDLRGVPAARFQDTNVGVLEAELRFDVTERWSLIGFTGVGSAWGRGRPFPDAHKPGSVGGGFRYLIARRLGLYAGLDVAHSSVDDAFYIQVGSGWR